MQTENIRTESGEQFIGTVDTWKLRQFRWPILQLLSRRFVYEMELGRYMKGLLATGRWDEVRVVPHCQAGGRLSDHVFDVYGRPASKPRASSRLGGSSD
jgi:hypothetical protein